MATDQDNECPVEALCQRLEGVANSYERTADKLERLEAALAALLGGGQ